MLSKTTSSCRNTQRVVAFISRHKVHASRVRLVMRSRWVNLLSRLTSNMTTFRAILTTHRRSRSNKIHRVAFAASVLIHAFATRGRTNLCGNVRVHAYSRPEAWSDDPEDLASRTERRRPLTRDDEGLRRVFRACIYRQAWLYIPEIGVSVAERSSARARARARVTAVASVLSVVDGEMHFGSVPREPSGPLSLSVRRAVFYGGSCSTEPRRRRIAPNCAARHVVYLREVPFSPAVRHCARL